ncbi:MAG TPA: efflux RND transporter periplasmic adaptor subunit [Burkholderiales bacterium]|nr:efflux RND transporter periplasmic adaptor subunit [Burkholderiales bacterium]
MNKRRVIAIVALVGIAATAAILWNAKPWVAKVNTGAVAASGTIDATEVNISFRVPGTLRRRPVDEGSVVKPGELLAVLDTREANARLRQMQAAELAAQARLRDMEQGYRPQEIAEARAQVQQVEANLTNLKEEARRSEILYATGAVSRQRRDKDDAAASVAQEQHQAAGERLKLLQSGFRKETIAAARAQVAEAHAAVDAAMVALEDLQVKSTINGTITRKYAEPGETLAAGRPVVTITDVAHPWVRVYIPENQIGKVRLGASARIKVDTFPDREFAGRVSYVSSQAEFTPKNVQTQEERVKLVFAVNVTADNPEGVLKPGMPADVYIATRDGAAR